MLAFNSRLLATAVVLLLVVTSSSPVLFAQIEVTYPVQLFATEATSLADWNNQSDVGDPGSFGQTINQSSPCDCDVAGSASGETHSVYTTSVSLPPAGMDVGMFHTAVGDVWTLPGDREIKEISVKVYCRAQSTLELIPVDVLVEHGSAGTGWSPLFSSQIPTMDGQQCSSLSGSSFVTNAWTAASITTLGLRITPTNFDLSAVAQDLQFFIASVVVEIVLIDPCDEFHNDPPGAITGLPNNLQIPAEIGSCSALVNWAELPVAVDFCDGQISAVSDIASGSTFDLGTTAVTYTATDSFGKVSTSMFTVTVSDDQAPEILGMPSSMTQTAEAGSCGATISWTAPTTTDNCPDPLLTSSHESGDTFSVGTTTVTYTSLDANGLSSSASFDISITDDEAPAHIGAPISQDLSSDAGSCGAVASWSAHSTSDNCGIASDQSTAASGDFFGLGLSTVTMTLTDTHGNSTIHEFTITVTDTEAPQLIGMPTSMTQTADAGSCGATTMWTAPTTTDNCPDPVLTSTHQPGDNFAVGTTTVTYTSLDANGLSTSASFDISISDDEAPAHIGAPISQELSNDLGSCGAVASWAAHSTSDNCGVASDTSTAASGDFFGLGPSTETMTLTDIHGNVTTHQFTITVTDTEAPQLLGMPTSMTQTAEAGSCGATIMWAAPTTTDNCPGAVLTSTHQPGENFPVGTTTVTYTSDDANGLSTSDSFDISISDDEAPAHIGAPVSQDLSSDSGSCGAVATWSAHSTSDNCGIESDVSTAASGEVYEIGATIVTMTLTDIHGNVTTHQFTITVTDNETPQLLGMPAGITQSADSGDCGAVINWTPPTTTDNCSGAVLTSTHQPGDNFPVGTTAVTYTSLDANGLSTSAAFDITVTDDEAPAYSGLPLSQNLGSDPGLCGAVATWAAHSTSDNCGIASDVSTSSSGDLFDLGTSTVTMTLTDSHGNSTTHQFSITVTDTEAPVIAGFGPGNNTATYTKVGVGMASLTAGKYSFAPPMPFAAGDISDNCTASGLQGAFTIEVAGVPTAVGSVVPGDTQGDYPYGPAGTELTWTVTDSNGVPSELILQTIIITVPDGYDCNSNGLPDPFEITEGIGGASDCNGNGLIDFPCDIETGCDWDLNQNAMLDSCECQLDLTSMVQPGGNFMISWNGFESISGLLIEREILDGMGIIEVLESDYEGSSFTDLSTPCYDGVRYTVTRVCENSRTPSVANMKTPIDINGDPLFEPSLADLNPVVIDGNHALMASPATATSNGIVSVYERDLLGEWTKLQELVATQPGAGFGQHMALKEQQYLIISAPDAAPGGSVFLYRWDVIGLGYTMQGEIKPQLASGSSIDPASGDRFGEGLALDIDSNRLLVGANGDDTSQVDAGAAYLFQLTSQGSFWALDQLAKLTLSASDAQVDDRLSLGHRGSLAIAGDYLVLGTDTKPNPESTADLQSPINGQAFLFYPDNSGNWDNSSYERLVVPGVSEGQAFGSAVAMSNNTIMVAADEDSVVAENEGAIYVFQRNLDDSWSFHSSIAIDASCIDPAGGPLGFGQDLAISGEQAFIGSNRETAFIFDNRCGSWAMTELMENVDPDFVHFGQYVALSGTTAWTSAAGSQTGPQSGTSQGLSFAPDPALIRTTLTEIEVHRQMLAHPEAGNFTFSASSVAGPITVYNGTVATTLEVLASIEETLTPGGSCGYAETHGFTMSMSHVVGDQGLSVVDLEALPFLGSTPDFVSPRIDNIGGGTDTGWTLGVIYSLTPPGPGGPVLDRTFDTPTDVVRASYEVVCGDWPEAGSTTLSFQDLNLGGSNGIISNQVAVGSLGYTASSGGILTLQIENNSTNEVFIRGDCSNDGNINIQDSVLLLNHLFSGTPVACRDASDVNDDGLINLVDPIYELMYIMGLGPVPPSPGVVCGADPTPDALECSSFNACSQECPVTP
ncbi:MAG: HYR domain-containing protein [bacterium]